MQQKSLGLRKFVQTNLVGFELRSLGQQASMLPIKPPLLGVKIAINNILKLHFLNIKTSLVLHFICLFGNCIFQEKE